MADQLEIRIPLTSDEVTELNTMCEALGTPLESFLTDTVKAAISAHRIRYQGHVQRMAAMAVANAGKKISIVNSATGERLKFEKTAPVVELKRDLK